MKVELIISFDFGNRILTKQTELPIPPFVGMEIYERIEDGANLWWDGEYTVTDVTVDLHERKIICGVEALAGHSEDEQIAHLTRLGWT